jgi:hypothetical protein
VPVGRDTALPPAIAPGAGRKTFRMFLVAALLVGGGVAFGLWRHSLAEAEVNTPQHRPRRAGNDGSPGTRTLLTEIDVPNHEGLLTPGTYCEVELQIPRKTESLIVPAEAVIFSRKGLSVAIVENGVVYLGELTVARDRGTTLEVSAGVKDDDQVIINPPGDISEGRIVRPQLVEAPNGLGRSPPDAPAQRSDRQSKQSIRLSTASSQPFAQVLHCRCQDGSAGPGGNRLALAGPAA